MKSMGTDNWIFKKGSTKHHNTSNILSDVYNSDYTITLDKLAELTLIVK